MGKDGRKLSATTIASYARDCNSFLRWTAKRGATSVVRMVVEAPSKAARKKKMQDSLLKQDEVAKLVESAKSLRDKIIVRIFAETGCRLGELLALTVGDIRREDGNHYVTFVDREGGRRLKTKDSARTLGIQKDLFKDLRDYLIARPGWVALDHIDIDPKTKRPVLVYRQVEHGDEDAVIFMSERRSRKNGYEALNESGVQQMLKHLAEDSEIAKPERVHAHMFRHLFSTEYLAGDKKPGGVRGDPVMLSKILGHSSLAMINDTYVHPDDATMNRAMLDHLDRLRKRA